MLQKKVTAFVSDLAAPLAGQLGLELVDVEYKKEGGSWYLRVFIDKKGGVTLDDCQALSRELDSALDSRDPIQHTYILEVSSPGIERPLKTIEDFMRFRGSMVKIITFKSQEGKKEHIGHLVDLSESTLVLKDQKKNNNILISLQNIASAHLVAEVFGGKGVPKGEQ
ncbi:MAG TPA: ribosome maturation factor RimP [Desulfotomaculum sp.]|nr:MAG: Ribosome maturation factor RimP [Desulfotomaculum sp. 46_80]HAG11707.1 ribosome maturation factor RimP [Desulfotomaculum sp.]HBY05021.1 ribosome maturation factor RimP [Desulfotomaculum sp.]